jgi:hypothetical protein
MKYERVTEMPVTGCMCPEGAGKKKKALFKMNDRPSGKTFEDVSKT